jgi:hypothetical protein
MPFDGTLGYLAGKLDVLRVESPTCGRQGRYHVARLVAELGPSTGLCFGCAISRRIVLIKSRGTNARVRCSHAGFEQAALTGLSHRLPFAARGNGCQELNR